MAERNTIRITTGSGKQCSIDYVAVEDISQSFTFYDLEDPSDIDGWRDFFEEYATKLAERLLQYVTVAKFSVSCTGIYDMRGEEGYTPPVTMNSAFPATLYRHTKDLQNKIENQMLGVHDPYEYHHRLEKYQGSTISTLEIYESFTMNFLFPEEFQVNSLNTGMRLKNCSLSSFADLIYNTDDFCVMHSIFKKIFTGEIKQRTSLNANETYMTDFNTWFRTNNLGKFYIDGIFSIDRIEELEKAVEKNLNLYTFYGNRVELYYRSTYTRVGEPINLIIIPMGSFYNKNNNKKTKVEIEFPITVHAIGGDNREFVQQVSISRKINKAHCSILETSFFKHGNHEKEVCRYCTGLFYQSQLANHEQCCRNSFNTIEKRERVTLYRELPQGKSVKTFEKYVAKYRIPFCTYDFETRLVDGRHLPFSFSIFYFNIFDPSKSKRVISSNMDHIALVQDFLQEIHNITEHHWNLQNVSRATAQEIEAAGEPPQQCPICLEKKDEMQYNHSHFRGDNKNLHLNRYICKDCNMAMTVRNKPLRFYAHNGARFDQNLFLEALLNSELYTGFDFIAKTESRFSQVTFHSKENNNLKVSLNDSIMILSESLANLAEAWVTDADDETVEKVLKVFYPGKNVTPLLEICKRKQVFPYAALHEEENLGKKLIEKELFYDNLFDRVVTESDYSEYISTSQKLEEVIGESYTFLDYHDFYLALDVILLALILNNFSERCYDSSGIWPLWFLSTSSYSAAALHHHNKYRNDPLPPIEIPHSRVLKFVQKSIKGGFSQIFNRQIPNFGENSLVKYVDFNSLYPSVMATVKLPYCFSKWIEPSTVEKDLKLMESLAENHYYFLEVDIEPLAVEFQEKNSKLPLFAENRFVEPEWISEDQHHRYRLNSKGKDFEGKTINVVTFFEKKNYNCTYSYLREAIRCGYRVSKIHKICEFHSGFQMRDYVTKMYSLKREASIEKNLKIGADAPKSEIDSISSRIAAYKIILNGLYGAQIINQDRHGQTELFSLEDNKHTVRKRISSLRFKSLLHCGNKTLVNSYNQATTLVYPLFLGSAILAESKLLMVRFVHTLQDFLLSKELPNFDPLMTDTDSYMFHMPEFFTVFSSYDEFAYTFNKECYSLFDTSFCDENKFRQPETHEAFCHMKDETKGIPITSFAGVCSKVYSFKTIEDSESVKGKGISKQLQKKLLSHSLYTSVVDGTGLNQKHTCEFGAFKVGMLKIENQRINKAYVTLVDIKSWYDKNGTKPLVFGSKEHLEKTVTK